MSMTELIDYLLTTRYSIPNREIINCLAIARLVEQMPKDTVFSWEQLGVLFGVTNQPYVSKLMKGLEKRRLIEYQAGVSGSPGYRITRVGPPPPRSGCPNYHRPTIFETDYGLARLP